jgi:hypothetical protein
VICPEASRGRRRSLMLGNPHAAELSQIVKLLATWRSDCVHAELAQPRHLPRHARERREKDRTRYEGGGTSRRSVQCEGLWHLICLCEEAVDSGLEIDDGSEDATFQAPLGQLGEVTLHGVEPGARSRREVEDEAHVV